MRISTLATKIAHSQHTTREKLEAEGGLPRFMGHQLKFRRLSGPYVVVRIAPGEVPPGWATKGEFTSISRSSDELSIVCPTENIPHDIETKLRWICLKLEGPFPFSLTGVLLSFIEPLSSKGIPIFAISTYDTDYVLVPEEWIGEALNALRDAGHEPV